MKESIRWSKESYSNCRMHKTIDFCLYRDHTRNYRINGYLRIRSYCEVWKVHGRPIVSDW